MLGHGYYSESSESPSPTAGEEEGRREAAVHWRRPYIITEAVPYMSLSEGLDYLPNQQVDETFLVALMEGLQCKLHILFF